MNQNLLPFLEISPQLYFAITKSKFKDKWRNFTFLKDFLWNLRTFQDITVWTLPVQLCPIVDQGNEIATWKQGFQ